MADDSLEGIRRLFRYGARKLAQSPGVPNRRPRVDPNAIALQNLYDALDSNTLWQPGIVSGKPENFGRLSTATLSRLRGYKTPDAVGPNGTHVGVDVLDLLPGHRMQLVREGVVTPEEMSNLEANATEARKR